MATGPQRLRELLKQPGALVAPGAFDCVSALILQNAGFSCIYQSGYGTAASMLGWPDAGVIGRAEMADQAKRLSQAVSVPVVSDADDGFGNPIGVMQTVRAFESAGAAGIHFEDQKYPKKCGHLAGKELISKDEMVQKVRAAVDARVDPAFLLIARCDARSVNGLDDALSRGEAYAAAGADMIFVESPYSQKEAEQIAQALKGIDLLWNSATGRTSDGGKTPWIPVEVLEELGYKLILFPAQLLWAAAQTMTDLAARMHGSNSFQESLDRIMPFSDFNDLTGLSEIPELGSKYSTP